MIGDPWPYEPYHSWPPGQPFTMVPPRKTMPIIVPISDFGLVTVVHVDSDGNMNVRVNQPRPEE